MPLIMKISNSASFRAKITYVAVVLCSTLLGTSIAYAQGKKKNPTSKIYVADLNGEAQIQTETKSGERIDNLAKKSAYNAQGTIVETKSKANNSIVFSNGTGAFFAEDTRVEIRRFEQEPFTPNRTDMDVEPSISHTSAFVARGAVGLSTSKQVAGSSMIYSTAQGSVNVRGGKVVIEAGDGETKISMIEGESSVKGGSLDLGGRTLKEGEQAIIRRSAPGRENAIQIIKIPDSERPRLEEKVTLAFMAKRTVYFDVRERVVSDGNSAAEQSGDAAAEPSGDGAAEQSGDGSEPSANEGGALTVFEVPDVPGNRSTPISFAPRTASVTQSASPLISTVTEIVPIEVVPVAPPTSPVSASRL